MINAIGKVLAYGSSAYILAVIILGILVGQEVLPQEAAWVVRLPVILIVEVTGPVPVGAFAGTLVAMQLLGFALMSFPFYKRKDK